MAIPHSELQKINPNSIIELFELELVEGLHYATGNPSNVPTIYRFHAGGNIIPNSAIGGGGDSSTNIVNVSVDASGSSVQGDGAMSQQLGETIALVVQETIVREKRNAGLLA